MKIHHSVVTQQGDSTMMAAIEEVLLFDHDNERTWGKLTHHHYHLHHHCIVSARSLYLPGSWVSISTSPHILVLAALRNDHIGLLKRQSSVYFLQPLSRPTGNRGCSMRVCALWSSWRMTRMQYFYSCYYHHPNATGTAGADILPT